MPFGVYGEGKVFKIEDICRQTATLTMTEAESGPESQLVKKLQAVDKRDEEERMDSIRIRAENEYAKEGLGEGETTSRD